MGDTLPYYLETKWNIAADASDSRLYVDDNEVREGLLSLYYVQRRSKIDDPGLGEMEVARLMRIPIQLIEFHIWYLKEKGWIQRLENGQFAITALSVDQAKKGRLRLNADRLLTAHGTEHQKDVSTADSEPARSFPVQSEDLQQ